MAIPAAPAWRRSACQDAFLLCFTCGREFQIVFTNFVQLSVVPPGRVPRHSRCSWGWVISTRNTARSSQPAISEPQEALVLGVSVVPGCSSWGLSGLNNPSSSQHHRRMPLGQVELGLGGGTEVARTPPAVHTGRLRRLQQHLLAGRRVVPRPLQRTPASPADSGTGTGTGPPPAPRGHGFGVVGTGMISEFHADAIAGLGVGSRLIGCYDAVPASAQRFGAKHGCRVHTEASRK